MCLRVLPVCMQAVRYWKDGQGCLHGCYIAVIPNLFMASHWVVLLSYINVGTRPLRGVSSCLLLQLLQALTKVGP